MHANAAAVLNVEKARLKAFRDAARSSVCTAPVYPGSPEQYNLHQYCTLKKGGRTTQRTTTAKGMGAVTQYLQEENRAMKAFLRTVPAPGQAMSFTPAEMPRATASIATIFRVLPGVVSGMMEPRMRAQHPNPNKRFEAVYTDVASRDGAAPRDLPAAFLKAKIITFQTMLLMNGDTSALRARKDSA